MSLSLWFWWFFGYALAYWVVLVRTSMPMVDDPSERAMMLFLSWLNPRQKREYLANNYFHVKGNFTGRTYRINKAIAPFNVQCIDDHAVRLCFVPHGASFTGDIMLAQKIGLETDEEHVLKIANHYNNSQGGVPCPEIPIAQRA
jgi:hypothetical protein